MKLDSNFDCIQRKIAKLEVEIQSQNIVIAEKEREIAELKIQLAQTKKLTIERGHKIKKLFVEISYMHSTMY